MRSTALLSALAERCGDSACSGVGHRLRSPGLAVRFQRPSPRRAVGRRGCWSAHASSAPAGKQMVGISALVCARAGQGERESNIFGQGLRGNEVGGQAERAGREGLGKLGLSYDVPAAGRDVPHLKAQRQQCTFTTVTPRRARSRHFFLAPPTGSRATRSWMHGTQALVSTYACWLDAV
eukprot:355524-Chlamydomonas_euryale.AAC.26